MLKIEAKRFGNSQLLFFDVSIMHDDGTWNPTSLDPFLQIDLCNVQRTSSPKLKDTKMNAIVGESQRKVCRDPVVDWAIGIIGCSESGPVVIMLEFVPSTEKPTQVSIRVSDVDRRSLVINR